jgi:hypothetical protein
MKQETLLRHILGAIEAGALVTPKVNLREMDTKTSRGFNQLREAEFIQGTFHDVIDAPPLIEGMPWLTLKGQEYLEKLRWGLWRRFVWGVGILWAAVTGSSYIISGLYYFHQLWPQIPLFFVSVF